MNKLTFKEDTHEYFYDGFKVPCVSNILKDLNLSGVNHIPEKNLKSAAEFGTNVHTATEYWDCDSLDWDSIDERTQNRVNQWIKFRENINLRFWVLRLGFIQLYGDMLALLIGWCM